MPPPEALLEEAARRRAGGAAVVCGSITLGYGDLLHLADRLGRSLAQCGARPGDRVAAIFPNCHLYLATYFAALQRSLVLVPVNTRLQPIEVGAILRHSGARTLIGSPEMVAALVPAQHRVGEETGEPGWCASALRPDLEEGEPGREDAVFPEASHLYYTSGTTGRPKGVVLTRRNLAAHVAMTLDELCFGPADVWLHAAPMFHLADAWAVWTATAAGATHVMLPRYEPREAWDLFVRAGVTLTNLVPTMIPGLLDAAAAGPRSASLRLLLSGGSPMAPALAHRIEATLGCDYAQTYGLTETSPFLTFSMLPDALRRRLSPADQRTLRLRTGRAARGVELRVVQPAASARFEDVPADGLTVGEVVARGETVTPGYWRDPEATAQAFLGGWFHTGDLGTLDAHRFVNLVDRAKDVIVTGGETVYSIEVEGVLLDHPEVREAAVFGVPDDTWGESVRAAVVGAVGEEALIEFCRGRIAAYKCPRAIVRLEALPRTGSGKIDKKALREPFWAGREKRIN